LDGIDKVTWTGPTIEQPVEGIWVFGGYGLAPISIIDTDEGLIAFDTGDTKHDGEIRSPTYKNLMFWRASWSMAILNPPLTPPRN
jgi:uncharacterized protein YfaT (DUF1175 family)